MVDIEKYCITVANNFSKLKEVSAEISKASEEIVDSLHRNGKVMFCGNGGSAADSQHLAAELMGRYLMERRPLPAIALTTDTSAITAIGNDYSYNDIFSRQVRGLAQKGDVLVGISTSGNSANVVHAFDVARELGVVTIGLTGISGGQMRDKCDVAICVPSDKTNHIQEMHIAIGHMICGIVEEELCSAKS